MKTTNAHREFAMEYIQEHYYVHPRHLAMEYENTPRGYSPGRGLTCVFANILSDFEDEGLIKKYNNNNVYKRWEEFNGRY